MTITGRSLIGWRQRVWSVVELLAMVMSTCCCSVLLAQGQTARPETLEQAWQHALAVDQTLAAKQLQHAAASQTLRAFQAQRWPVASAGAAYQFRDSEQSFRFTSPALPPAARTFPYQPADEFSVEAKIGIPLYTSGRIRHDIASGRAQQATAEWEVAQYLIDVKLLTAQEYVAVLQAERHVWASEERLSSLQARAQNIQRHFQQQTAVADQLLEAQVAAEQARLDLHQALHQLEVARAVYNRRLARPLDARVVLADVDVPAIADRLDLLTTRALNQRPDLRQLDERIAALRHQAASLKATQRPQVEWESTYTFHENPFQTPKAVTASGIGVLWNFFDGGSISSRAKAVSSEAEALAHLQSDLRSHIVLEVRTAWLGVQQAQRQRQYRENALCRAQEHLRVVARHAELGMATSQQVLDAQTMQTQAQCDLDCARLDHLLAYLKLRHAAGDL